MSRYNHPDDASDAGLLLATLRRIYAARGEDYDAIDKAREEERKMKQCEVPGCISPAITRSSNPDWSGYRMCGECAAEYDSRKNDPAAAKEERQMKCTICDKPHREHQLRADDSGFDHFFDDGSPDSVAAELERLQQRNRHHELGIFEACGRLQAGVEFAIDWLEGSRPMTSRAEAAEWLRGLLNRTKKITKL